MRTISIITTLDDTETDHDVFDLAHSYRFFLFSTVDILNGVSILYCFKCMADCDIERRKKVK
jgi:hypothetical protein